ncbi:MAG: hypothetical protein KC620_20095, partial [Myxococcales bacterium]|nr:hypothetical protein [Myxococcales bacterium]
MNRSRTLFACLVILTASPAAAEPCGGLAFDGGRVVSARPLRAVEKPAPVEAECLDAIGKQLGGRASVRSITVAVRLSDAERAAGAGMRIGDQVKAALVRGGVPEARVSVVVPTATEGEQGTLAITFTEK